jgi:methyl-accepting chemotaxis protein
VLGKSAEKLDPKVVCRDDQCDLGKWIHERKKIDKGAEHAELAREHAAFHVHAASVLDAVAANKAQEAQQILDGPYARISAKVVMLIKQLREKAA